MKVIAKVMAGALLAGSISLSGAAVASADNLQNVIDSDGTQGEWTDSVAGEWDDDGEQAADVRDSVATTPQNVT